MDTQRAARAFRAVRLHLGLRQVDVAERAGVSQQHVSDLERGSLGAMTLDEASQLFEALDIRAVLTVSWRGAELDRLLDEGHAAVGVPCAEFLQSLGWQVVPEVTYSVYGERGSIDLLAWHAESRILLVVEIKTEIASAEEMLRRHDAKVRLGSRIGREQFGVAPAAVARLLVIDDTSANRARANRLSQILQIRYPLRGRALRNWLCAPAGTVGGLLFLNTARGGGKHVHPKRVRTKQPPSTAAGGVEARSGR